MIGTAYCDDDVMVCERIRPQIINGILPDGYMTSGEFRRVVKNDIYEFCRDNGYL
ncbi:MAG: hypothetical protein LBN95_12755 [Prevotellaceae bacterium]|jgi:hypothetical protein|nr:hypothetical protein [Prevotellaceae bacterium]